MGKTERILDLLPPTFAPVTQSRQPGALFAIADAVGRVLQDAENDLVELMKAHWIEFADRGRATVRDLDLIGALASVQAWEGEDVEEFRARLARRIRSLFAGTVTVPGILRVAADVLGEEAGVEQLDHPGYLLTPDLADAGLDWFGFRHADVSGSAATPPAVRGLPGLGDGVDLRDTPGLRLEIDGTIRDLDLAAAAAEAAAVRPAEIRAALDAAFGTSVAVEDGDSVEIRAADSIAFPAVDGDAADPVFGVAARRAHATAATAATATGTVDLPAALDLRATPFLRLAVDGGTIREIALAGADPAAVTPEEIRAAIDEAFGTALTRPGLRLVVVSPTTGAASTVAVQPAAAQDAAPLLFGPGPYGVRQGADARPARITGRTSLASGADLSIFRRLAIRDGDGDLVEVDCAGPDPSHTDLTTVTERINAAVGADVATHDGAFLTLTAAGDRIEVATAAGPDAAEALLGLRPTQYLGTGPAPARLRGAMPARPRPGRIVLRLADGPELRISVPGATTAPEVVSAINREAGGDVAGLDDDRLLITSPTGGATSRVRLVSRLRVDPARHVTRAALTGGADAVLLGTSARSARAVPAGTAQVTGTADLSAGVNLGERFFVRIAVDDDGWHDVDCRGTVPSATTASEAAAALGARVDGGHLVLTSALPGPQGRILIGRSTATDAATVLLGATGTAVGEDGSEVSFTSTRDLSAGLLPGLATLLRISVDASPPVTIDLGGPASGQVLDGGRIADRINTALGGQIATFDGALLAVTSPAARLEFAVPDDPARDATEAVFGITAPRTYRTVPAPAELTGTVQLPAVLDLRVRRHLRLGLDGAAPVDVDCAGPDPAATTPLQVVDRINGVLGSLVATLAAGRLRLLSPVPGAGSVVSVLPCTAADSRDLVLGDVPDRTSGSAARPAELTGETALPGAVDLSRHGVLRLAIDDIGPVDVDMTGLTSASEVVSAINDALPGTARIDGDRLVLSGMRRVDVRPARSLTVTEYPTEPVPEAGFDVVQGTEFVVTNPGTGGESFRLGVIPVHGVRGLTLRNRTVPATITAGGPVGPGERLVIELVDGVPAATVDGRPVPVEVWPTAAALTLPAGPSTWRWTGANDSRFDLASFDRAWFAGGGAGPGIFDAGRFVAAGAGRGAFFAGPGPAADAVAARVTFAWAAHRPGRFRVGLPWDLPPRFGARFGMPGDAGGARFTGRVGPAVDVVLRPPAVAESLVDVINNQSTLLTAEWQPVQPPSEVAMRAPWPVPVRLTAGVLSVAADVPGAGIRLTSRIPGPAGDRIEVTLSGNGPGRYALTVGYTGDAVFEVATERVRAALADARAAGIGFAVDRTSAHD